MTVAAPLDFSSLPAFMNTSAEWVGRELMQRLPQGEPAQYLYQPARDYPSRGGKRFRPALLLLANALVGGDVQRALPSALALELFQNFALVHDDIEDDSQLRRGQPTLHRLHGIPLAINVGDFLLGHVYETLAENESLLGPEAAWTVARLFGRVFRETFEGQALDIGWAAHGHLPSRQEFQTMIQKKTGWYSGRGPCLIGAMLGGASPAVSQTLGDFGELLGIGFQLRDDLLNLAADSADQSPTALAGGYGKEQGGDIAEGKRTLIVIELLERLDQAAGQRLGQILRQPAAQTSQADIQWVIAQAQATGALAAVHQESQRLGQAALDLLHKLPQNPQTALLRELTQHLVVHRMS